MSFIKKIGSSLVSGLVMGPLGVAYDALKGDGAKAPQIPESEHQKALAQIAAEKWNYSQSQLAPLLEQYMQRTDEMNTQGAYDYQAGRSNEEAQIIQHDQRMQYEQQAQQAGVNPSSGRAIMGLSQLGAVQAEAAGEHSGRAQFEQTNQYLTGQQNISAIGLGQASQAQMGMGDVARLGLETSRANAFNTFNRRSSNMQLAGSMLGATVGYGQEKGWLPKFSPSTSKGDA